MARKLRPAEKKAIQEAWIVQTPAGYWRGLKTGNGKTSVKLPAHGKRWPSQGEAEVEIKEYLGKLEPYETIKLTELLPHVEVHEYCWCDGPDPAAKDRPPTAATRIKNKITKLPVLDASILGDEPSASEQIAPGDYQPDTESTGVQEGQPSSAINIKITGNREGQLHTGTGAVFIDSTVEHEAEIVPIFAQKEPKLKVEPREIPSITKRAKVPEQKLLDQIMLDMLAAKPKASAAKKANPATGVFVNALIKELWEGPADWRSKFM